MIAEKPFFVKRTNSEKTFRDGTVIRETEFKTPVGSISVVSKFVPQSVSSVTIKYPVVTRQDLKVLQYRYKNQAFKLDYSRPYDRLKNWNGVRLVSSSAQRTSFQILSVGWVGVANTVRFTMREPEEVEENIQVMVEANNPIYKAVCNSPTPSAYFRENLTSDVISPPVFRKYHVPYYENRVK